MSLVQELALEVSLEEEDRLRFEDLTHRIKAAVVSYNPEMLPSLYPSPSPDTKEYVEVSPNEDLSDTAGEWVFNDDIAPEQAEKIMQTMLTSPMTMTAEDAEAWQ